MEFRVVVEAQPNSFHAWCPNLKGCHSWGATVEEAMEYIEEALQFYVDNVDHNNEEAEAESFELPPLPRAPIAN